MSVNAQYIIKIRADQNLNDIKFRDKNQLEKKETQSPLLKKKSHSRSPAKTSSRQAVYTQPANFMEDIDFCYQSAKSAKDNINKGLQFIKMLDSFNQQHRCLQHNNIITLYCLNDRKLLCVYCIYGVHKHRSHKLLPAYEHMQYILQDVNDLQDRYNEYIRGLDQIVDKSKSFTQFFQNLLKKSLSEIQTQYMKRKMSLQQIYQKQKSLIIKTYEQVIQKSYQISNQYEEMKFNIWEYQARYNLDKRPKIFRDNNINNKNTDKKKQSNTNQSQKNTKNTKNKQQATNNNKKGQKKPQNQAQQIQNQKIQLSNELRQILCKHIVLNHIVSQMQNIQPYKIDQKTIQKKILNKSNLILLNTKKDLSKSKNTSMNQL